MANQQTITSKPNHLKDLLLLFAIPIGIAVFAATVIYLPSLFANPKTDFIYSTCDDYRCKNRYTVDSSGYVSLDYPNSSNYDYYDRIASLRYYDAKNDSTRTLTLEEAKKYQLNTSSKSPDGYSVTRESSDSGFLFWGDYDEGWYLKNGAKKKKVELSTNDSYYSSDIKFLGWVNK
ncbi:hypothetical protein IT415_01025 [bacterium]|nr:hypothetical protein [bacterium]